MDPREDFLEKNNKKMRKTKSKILETEEKMEICLRKKRKRKKMRRWGFGSEVDGAEEEMR